VFDGREVTNLDPRQLLELGMSYVPQGRNVFPELSVLHNLELGATSAGPDAKIAARIESLMERFPMLRARPARRRPRCPAASRSLLEIARGLLLEPKLMLIDEPSIGLSPLLVKETFGILQDLRAKGVSILMVEAERQARARNLGLRRGPRAGPHADRSRRERDPRRPRVGQLFPRGHVAGS